MCCKEKKPKRKSVSPGYDDEGQEQGRGDNGQEHTPVSPNKRAVRSAYYAQFHRANAAEQREREARKQVKLLQSQLTARQFREMEMIGQQGFDMN